MKLFSVVMLGIIVFIGALVGGVSAVLLPHISVGVELGVLGGLYATMISYSFMNLSETVVCIFFVLCLVGANIITRKYEMICSYIRTSLFVGLIFSLSVDNFLKQRLFRMLSNVLGGFTSTQDRDDFCVFKCYIPQLIVLWSAVTLFAFALIVIQNGMWSKLFHSENIDYSALSDKSTHGGDTHKSPQQRTFSYPDTLEYNFYDPDNLPAMLTPYADIVFPSVQNIAKLFGFQVDSSRNQAEHLLMMLTNETMPSDTKLNAAPERLHRKMFSNYRKWCDRMGTPPHFSKPLTGRRHIGPIEDMLMLLLLWGEAANLRHLPECTCFLYHKTMTEYISRKDIVFWRNVYPGYFLDMVVTPIYEVISSSFKKSGDNETKMIYDDFNEFFWSPQCLQFRIFEQEVDENMESGLTYTSLNTLDSEGHVVGNKESMHISRGLANASKTYLEKRSWFHALYSMKRIFEWHVVTFTLIASVAFSIHLQWSWSFSFQIASVVFWMISVMGIFWTCLEVWTLFPNTEIPGHSIFGYILRILAGFLILVYQSVYYHWSFRPDDSPALAGTPSWIHYAPEGTTTADSGGANFWWWQYLWLSLFSCALYFLESVLCWFPSIVSSFMTWDNDYFQALLNICYPLSQMYVGKVVHTPQKDVFRYILFWFIVLSWKFVFGYYFIIAPITTPTLELYDDYMNFQRVPFSKTCLLMWVWWFPHFLVYMIDLSIWYSVMSSMAGAVIALQERQGAVRDPVSFRSHFMRAPQAFCQKIMPTTSSVGTTELQRNLSTSSILNLASKMKMSEDKKDKDKKAAKKALSSSNEPSNRSQSSADLSSFEAGSRIPFKEKEAMPSNSIKSYQSEEEEEEEAGGSVNTGEPLGPKVNLFLDVRSARWVCFGRVWNEVISNLRQTDHLSNNEKRIMLFSSFSWLRKPIYLPLYLTAGCVDVTVHGYRDTVRQFNEEKEPHAKILVLQTFKSELGMATIEALGEISELLRFVITKLLGILHTEDCDTIFGGFAKWFENDDIFTRLDSDKAVQLINLLKSLLTKLKGCVKNRAKNPVVTSDVRKELSSSKARKQTDEDEKSRKRLDSLDASAQGQSGPSESRGNKGMVKSVSSGALRKSVSTGFLAHIESDSINQSSTQRESAGIMSPDRDSRTFTKLLPFRKGGGLIDRTRDSIRDDVRNFFTTLRSALLGAGFGGIGSRTSRTDAATQDLKDRATFILSLENGFMWDDLYASAQIDELAADTRVKAVLDKAHGLLALRQSEVDPVSHEATRRIHFFVNSLFMEMPLVPTTRFCKEYTCLTPFYSEDVLLSRADLESKNSDGLMTLLYLRTLYRNDWANFCERNGLNVDSDLRIWSPKHLLQVRMWASYRAQTLFRTVEGMMYSEAAIRLVAELEQLLPWEIDVLAPLKFNYVVACQVYGSQRRAMDSKADDIEFLLSRHPNLRVAYIDSIRTNRSGEMTFYSVLIKHDDDNDEGDEEKARDKKDKSVAMAARTKTKIKEERAAIANGGYSGLNMAVKEVYRVKLPGNAVIGEGKPENQNHALIFTRGRYIQAMDMNQDGYFEEAFKMRNLLEEFNGGSSILGFREHIFTGSVSSVANYMALQELSFVTLGQRVLYNPLRIRQHYGHPDVFDKLFVMTEGGMSKSSKGINLSEDVFAGFNATIRGKSVLFKEYVQAGKGRDVGLQQTYKFEAKLAQGNAEQSLSRDMSRICDRLDFFRVMSFFYGGIGHYICCVLVMFTLVVVVYFMACLALYDEEGVDGRKMTVQGVVNMMMSGMGILQTLPLFVTLTVEKGLGQATSEILWMLVSGGPLYFIFHIQTKSYYFSQTLLAGGAMYRPTGRGFVTRHSSFDENWRFFASSHIYLGFDLLVALILLGLYTTSTQYAGLTWSVWLAAVSFVIGPFWFNPITFEWEKVKEDYVKWQRWMEEKGGSSEQSWDTWWKEENSFYGKTDYSWKVFLLCQKCVPWLFVAGGLFGTGFLKNGPEMYKLFELVLLVVTYFVSTWCLRKLEKQMSYALRRFLSMVVSGAALGCVLYLFCNHLSYIRYTAALYYVSSSLVFIFLLAGSQHAPLIFYKFHDYVVGNFIFMLLGVMSLCQVGALQTWLLYHNALSAGVVIEDVLKYARSTKENTKSDSDTAVTELKAQVAEQQALINEFLRRSSGGGGLGSKGGVHVGYGSIESPDRSSPDPFMTETSGVQPLSLSMNTMNVNKPKAWKNTSTSPRDRERDRGREVRRGPDWPEKEKEGGAKVQHIPGLDAADAMGNTKNKSKNFKVLERVDSRERERSVDSVDSVGSAGLHPGGSVQTSPRSGNPSAAGSLSSVASSHGSYSLTQHKTADIPITLPPLAQINPTSSAVDSSKDSSSSTGLGLVQVLGAPAVVTRSVSGSAVSAISAVSGSFPRSPSSHNSLQFLGGNINSAATSPHSSLATHDSLNSITSQTSSLSKGSKGSSKGSQSRDSMHPLTDATTDPPANFHFSQPSNMPPRK